MNALSIVLLVVTTAFAVVLGVWYGRSLIQARSTKQSKLIKQQLDVKHKRIIVVESFIKRNKRITNREVQELLRVSRATAERYLDQLERDGKLVQKGAGRGAHYILK